MIYIIIIVFLLFQMGFRGNAILTNLYAISLGANTMTVGLIIGLAAFFPMLFAVAAGRVSDRIGYRWPIICGSFGVSAALLLPFIFRETVKILLISQCLFGLAFIFVIVNTQNLVGSISTSENRSQNYALYSLGLSTAGLLGPLITGFSIDYLGYSITYLFLAIMTAVPGILISLNIFKLPKRERQTEDTEPHGIIDLLKLRSLRKIYLTSAVLLIGTGIYELFFPIYGKSIGLSASLIGMVLSIYASAFFIVRFLMPVFLKRFGEKIIFIACLLISAGAFLFVPLSDSFWKLAIVSFILGIGLGCGQPLSIVMAYNASPEGRTGEVLGTRLMINKTVQFFVPLLFGSFGTLVSFIPLFWSGALLLFSGGVISLLDHKASVKLE